MDRSIVNAETYVLKTKIHCTGCEKKLKKLLQNISGVHRVSIDAEQGNITVSGTIDPYTLTMLVRNKSDFLLEPVIHPKRDLQLVPKQKSATTYNGLNDQDVVAQLQKLSELKGLKYVELTKYKMKLTFNGGDDFGRENGTFSTTNSPMHRQFHRHHEINNDYDFNHMQYCICNGCQLQLPPTCRCMASQGSAPVTGIPWPGYINTPLAPISAPSAPPEPYSPPPSYNHPFYSTFSDDNPRSCMVM